MVQDWYFKSEIIIIVFFKPILNRFYFLQKLFQHKQATTKYAFSVLKLTRLDLKIVFLWLITGLLGWVVKRFREWRIQASDGPNHTFKISYDTNYVLHIIFDTNYWYWLLVICSWRFFSPQTYFLFKNKYHKKWTGNNFKNKNKSFSLKSPTHAVLCCC